MNKSDEYFEALEYVKHLNRVKDIASEILSGEWPEISLNPYEPMDIFPWDAIAYSMLKNCETVKFDYDECPNCSKKGFCYIISYRETKRYAEIFSFVHSVNDFFKVFRFYRA